MHPQFALYGHLAPHKAPQRDVEKKARGHAQCNAGQPVENDEIDLIGRIFAVQSSLDCGALELKRASDVLDY